MACIQAELAGAAVSERESTAQEPGQVHASEWEVWDSKRSLFDNHTSTTFEKNIEYMYKSFGFHFPDWEYLRDPEGLLQCAPRFSTGLLSLTELCTVVLRFVQCTCRFCVRIGAALAGIWVQRCSMGVSLCT